MIFINGTLRCVLHERLNRCDPDKKGTVKRRGYMSVVVGEKFSQVTVATELLCIKHGVVMMLY